MCTFLCYWILHQILAHFSTNTGNQYRLAPMVLCLNKSISQSHLLRQYFTINKSSANVCFRNLFSPLWNKINISHLSLFLSSQLASCPRCRRWQRRKSQQKNNDKLCVLEQNWLNRSGFCGFSVHSYKQLVIAINKFRVYPFRAPDVQSS